MDDKITELEEEKDDLENEEEVSEDEEECFIEGDIYKKKETVLEQLPGDFIYGGVDLNEIIDEDEEYFDEEDFKDDLETEFFNDLG